MKNVTKICYDKSKITTLIQLFQQINLQTTESNIKIMYNIFNIVENWDLELTDEDLETLNKNKTE